MVNRLGCGTTERDREIVKDVSSGIPRCHIQFTSCGLYFVSVTEEEGRLK